MGLLICAAPDLDAACKRSMALRKCSEEQCGLFIKVAQWILAHVPYLASMLPLLEERPLDLIILSNFIDHHGRAGRTADLSTLKDHIHDWIPDVILEIAGDDEPIILSPPWMAYRCIWTSPVSARKEPGVGGTGHASISRVHSIDNVTPENIAYIACLLRHILSSKASWKDQDVRVFNGKKFFDKIVDLLNSNGFSKAVLAYFVSQVYGATAIEEPDDELDELESIKRALAAQDALPEPSTSEP
ncbi:hypothetical protein BN946_scf184943.g4 [Trametes cinnabarina]|uniref:Uncharacterized protein n=1 Tax=Pycnoporus cinnabarinus TaxID=5643 RepID=A0A060SC78_PYCCI|nr:hypothetical protein BN946_scf184943.g4 [Trametes cinnabarina]